MTDADSNQHSAVSACAVETIEFGDVIRPEGWSHAYETLGVEDTEVPNMVKVLWFVGCEGRMPHPFPPDAATYFERGEMVEVTR